MNDKRGRVLYATPCRISSIDRLVEIGLSACILELMSSLTLPDMSILSGTGSMIDISGHALKALRAIKLLMLFLAAGYVFEFLIIDGLL